VDIEDLENASGKRLTNIKCTAVHALMTYLFLRKKLVITRCEKKVFGNPVSNDFICVVFVLAAPLNTE